MSLEVVIPAYKPDRTLTRLIGKLNQQAVKPDRIRILLSASDTAEVDGLKNMLGSLSSGVDIEYIAKEDFSHGGTRQYAMDSSGSDYVLFMTQDAVPCDDGLTEELLGAFASGRTAVAYARQIAYSNADNVEKFTRRFNYPAKSRTQTKADLAKHGVKAVFCSDVCAMYDRKLHSVIGGFDCKAEFGEDAIFAYNALMAGYNVEYRAEAKVYHSHNLSLSEQFLRSRTIAVSQKAHPEIYRDLKSESEGIRYMKSGVRFFFRKKKYRSMCSLILTGTVRYAGYFCGKHFGGR